MLRYKGESEGLHVNLAEEQEHGHVDNVYPVPLIGVESQTGSTGSRADTL